VRILLICVCLTMSSSLAAAQKNGTTKEREPTRPAKAATAAATVEQQRFAAILTIRNIAARLQEVSDTRVKARALAKLGDLLWKDDEPYARQLFLRAYELTAKTDQMPLSEVKNLAALRKEILGPIAHRDPNLARKLIEDQKAELTEAQRAETNLSIAYQLLDSYGDNEAAEGFARSSFNQGMNVVELAVWLLELRERNQRSADLLFKELLQTFVSQPVAGANDCLYLGTYLFTSPRAVALGPTTRSISIIGGVPVPDLTADRPNTPAALVREYLAAAANILLRETTDPREQKLRYVTIYMLIPKAERVARDLLPALFKARQALTGQVPPEFTQPQTFAKLNRPPLEDQTELDRVLEEIGRLPDQTRRDVRYVSVVFALWSKGNFLRAREVINKVSDLKVQLDLNCVVDFGDAASQLDTKTKNLAPVENVAKKLPCSLERAMLWLAIANARKATGNKQRARESLDEGLTTARSIDDAHRPYLLLNVAGQYADLDASLGQQVFREAVKEFNEQTGEKVAALNWNREITIGPLTQPFALKIKGADPDFENNVRALVNSDAESAIATLKTLTNEPALTAGLLAAAKSILK
jgi:hypothetical protein